MGIVPRAIRRPFARMGVRDRLLLAVLATTGLALITMTVVFNLVLTTTLTGDVDARLQKLGQDEAKLVWVGPDGVGVPQPTARLSDGGTQVWVFVGGKTVSGPTVNTNIDAAVKSLYGTAGKYLDVPGSEVRLFSTGLYYKDNPIGTIVTGVSMAPVYRTQRVTLVATAAFTALLLIIVGFAGRWALGAAFRPVSQMTSEAEERPTVVHF